MWKNRAGYGVMILAALVLFISSGQPFMAYIAAVMSVLAVLTAVLIRRDASRISMELSVPGRVMEGKEIALVLNVRTTGRIWVTQKLIADIEMKNQMFGKVHRELVEVLFSKKKKEYRVEIPLKCCGQIEFTAKDIAVQDLFRFARVRTGDSAKLHCICYPRRMNIQVETSRKTIGTPKNEGVMQNRKGNDPSEMYDIREYVPGDDIRSIHWKLSSKTDSLILREPSNPSHYRVAVLADYGVENWDQEDRTVKEKEWNTIIAAGSAICKGLADKGEKFCMIFPGINGLESFEIENRQDYVRMLTQWMCMPMKKEQGTGYRYFMKQGLDQEFSRLVILSAGRYEQKLNRADNRIGITIVSAVNDIETVRGSQISESCEMIEIPVEGTDGVQRIIC